MNPPDLEHSSTLLHTFSRSLLKLKIHWSSWLLLTFFSLLLFVSFFAEVFQTSSTPRELAQMIKNPIPVEKFDQVRSLVFTNKLGVFKFENTHPQGERIGPWQMTHPTAIGARKDFFHKVFEALTLLKVQNLLAVDPINLQSFSLDSPLYSFEFNFVNNKKSTLSFGLTNPIDNTTYFTLNDESWIYQSQALSLSLDNVGADQILDARVLAFQIEQVNFIELKSQPFIESGLTLQKQDSEWKKNQTSVLNAEKVLAYLQGLLDLKSYMVLDKLNQSQNLEMEKIMLAPQWRLKIGQKGYAPEIFYLTGLITQIGDFKLEKGSSALFYKEGAQTPLVLTKTQYTNVIKALQEI